MMHRADQNGDGVISFDEAVENLPGMTEQRFERMDADGDGQLAPEELRARSGRGEQGRARGSAGDRFSAADRDGDGKLNREEVQAGMPRFPMERFDAVDLDGDGALTLEELAQSRNRSTPEGDHRSGRAGMVERLDRDGDGEISLDEFRAVRPDMTEERFSAVDTNRSGGISRSEFRAAAGERRDPAERREFLERVFAERDGDGDGALSLEEAQGGPRPMPAERFNRLDANGDGELSKEEFTTGFGRAAPGRSADGHRRPVDPN